MAKATGATGAESKVRVVVFKENDADQYVAQCLEYDIAVQAPDVDRLFDRLRLTLQAEFEMRRDGTQRPFPDLGPAPIYYFSLWENRSTKLMFREVPLPPGVSELEVCFARAA